MNNRWYVERIVAPNGYFYHIGEWNGWDLVTLYKGDNLITALKCADSLATHLQKPGQNVKAESIVELYFAMAKISDNDPWTTPEEWMRTSLCDKAIEFAFMHNIH